MIDRRFFFDYVRRHLFGKLTAKQVEGLEALLNMKVSDTRAWAYVFATVHHETDTKMQPIEEYGKGRGKPYGKVDPVTGKAYYGRGLVQLTWLDNYRRMSKVVGLDLVKHPEFLLRMDVSIKILHYGMIHGSFTGKKLSDYFTQSKSDWVNARRIINGTDKANLIAGYAKQYYAAISFT